MENGSAPATKQDVLDATGALRREIGGATTSLRNELGEAIRDSQTELLKAFYNFAESNRQRVSQLEGNQGALIVRVGVLEERILQLERKVNFPQHPPQ
jgi:hypothetical protein